MVDVKDPRKEKEEMQTQGAIERKTYTEQWKETQRRKSSDLGLEMPMEQNQHLLMQMLQHKEGLD